MSHNYGFWKARKKAVAITHWILVKASKFTGNVKTVKEIYFISFILKSNSRSCLRNFEMEFLYKMMSLIS